jgi:hypothetical protein
MVAPKRDVSLGERIVTYATILKQLDLVVSELETVGFVTANDRDKWERLIAPERLRCGVAMKSLGVSPLAKIPAFPEKAKAAGA